MSETLTYYKFSPETTAGWKSYPVRIRGPRPSKCHQAPTLLVQSMKGGFVSANCSECGGKDILKQDEFLNLGIWAGCPQCGRSMDPTLLSELRGTARLAGNYGYVCSPCELYILLADLLPHWQDVIPRRTPSAPKLPEADTGRSVADVDAEYLPRLHGLLRAGVSRKEILALNAIYQAARRAAASPGDPSKGDDEWGSS